jgi:putative ABC transport system permease protein
MIKNKSFSIINIFGLSLSISVCLLIISLITGLSEYDRFHSNYEDIYRVLSKKSNEATYSATAPMPVRYKLMKDYPGIKKVVTFKRGFGGDASYEDTSVPLFGYFCSEELFNVFSFDLIKGNPDIALSDPFSVILTKESAKKLFGEEDPIGKIIRFSERGLVIAGIPNKNKPTYIGDYTVTGVMNELDGKTHLQFEILASLSTLPLLELQGKESTLMGNWKNTNESYHYVLLDNHRDESYLQSILGQISNSPYAAQQKHSILLQTQPLSKITPGKMYRNPFSYRLPIQAIYFLALLATVVILSACFNYTNLSLAKSLSRSKEIGIRKVSGAVKYQIVGQFIGESVLISMVSLIIAIGILQFLQPAFNSLWFTRYINIDMSGNWTVYLIFFVFSVIIGIMAGIIPALHLSSFKPLNVLKDSHRMKIFSKITLRKTLIVTQFAASLFFIITTLLIYYQMNYLMHSEYGFNKENVLNVPLQGNNYEKFASLVKNHSDISGISGSSVVLTTGGTSYTYLKSVLDPNDSTGMSEIYADRNFVENMGLTILAGENFPERITNKYDHHILVNEVAVKKLGYENPQDLIGNSFMVQGMDDPLIIVGVLKDFHYSDLIQGIGPLIMRDNPDNFRYANIRINPDNQTSIIPYIGEKWKEMDKDHAFEPQFMDQQIADSHAVIGDIGYIIGFISILAVSIACLGLLGMVIYITQTRVKEIGIRKVHGATIRDAIWVLSRDFLILMAIAIVIATPLSKLFNDLWLRQFAVHVKFGIEVLSAGILIITVLGIFTIFSQTLKSSKINPAETLRYE